MIWSGVTACLWVLAATATAFLPMRRQRLPGAVLLAAAPVLILWLLLDLGWPVALVATLGFVSMFRHPLRYLIARVRGRSPVLPPEIRG
ncbi:Protein of unknown function [Loktanella atrilutea]|uniref:UDP-N-acetylmuramate--alanine ligase n=1 Tax=Loktanella atrilutea TaxID=366533 RepID=A0A1M5B778_LOKAT|nr:DUF2484 family protein [Loktanella atrilutea]SHF38373.1 Protein of unknown function [Loktanella atrilutea]